MNTSISPERQADVEAYISAVPTPDHSPMARIQTWILADIAVSLREMLAHEAKRSDAMADYWNDAQDMLATGKALLTPAPGPPARGEIRG